MLINRAQRHMELRTRLARARPLTSLMECEILAVSPEIVATTTGWVPLFVDTGHAITMGPGSPTAYRAIDRSGQLLWLVEGQGEALLWLSRQPYGAEAIARARDAWDRQIALRREWGRVEALARDLATGRRRLRVTIEDVRAAPVPDAAVDAFMARMHLSGKTRVSGRTAALLMKVEPAVGFVIWQAHLRQGGAPEPAAEAAAEA